MASDLDDLVDATGVAELLGLRNRTSVSVYQQRYPDMPRPVLDFGVGRPRLWSRRELQAWRAVADRRTPQQVVKQELAELRAVLVGDDLAKGLFCAAFAAARQHGLGRGRREGDLAPTRRAAFELALAEARSRDLGFEARLGPGWLDEA